NVDAYSVPQEYANRTGVRDVAITNDYGDGIRIIANKSPLECSVSPYNALELDNAKHYYDLPNINHTVVTVAGTQMDVGGDDSWGAPVHEEFRISAEEDFSFEFIIEPAKILYNYKNNTRYCYYGYTNTSCYRNNRNLKGLKLEKRGKFLLR